MGLFRASKWYIVHEDQEVPENGIAVFGPFPKWELYERLNDGLADCLADSGPIEEVLLSPDEQDAIYINPRRMWMETLRGMR